MSENLHGQCHDLVCNAHTKHPRGTANVGCSCNGRMERLHQELAALTAKHEALEGFVRGLGYLSNKEFFGEPREKGAIFCIYDQRTLKNLIIGKDALDAWEKLNQQQG